MKGKNLGQRNSSSFKNADAFLQPFDKRYQVAVEKIRSHPSTKTNYSITNNKDVSEWE